MGIQFFGEFLIDRWVITRGQLLEALELQEYRNTKFGELAVQNGLLSKEQVQQVNEGQRSQDMRFGDLAMQMGLLDENQVRQVLTMQKNNYLYLGESLLELGHVTDDILERELAIFEEEQARFAQEIVPVPEGVLGADLVAACADLTRKLMLRVVGLMIKLGDATLVPGAPGEEEVRREDFHLIVSLPLISDVPVRYVLAASSSVSVAIASKIIGEDATRETEEMVEDAVGEFCNIVCGNVAARMAQKGVEVEIGPPETHTGFPEPEEGRLVVRYPIKVADGFLDMRFLVQPKPVDPSIRTE
jgi:CheY-specific phosphatase CheX